MGEILELCHLCGTPMGSRAPICPKCFGRSDPAAREAIRLEEARLEAEQKRLRELQWIEQSKQFDQLIWWSMVCLVVVVAAVAISSFVLR